MLFWIIILGLILFLVNQPLKENMHPNDGTFEERTIRHVHDEPGRFHYFPFLQSPYLWYTSELPRRLLPPWYTLMNQDRMQTPAVQMVVV
jgi:hypothetical protein